MLHQVNLSGLSTAESRGCTSCVVWGTRLNKITSLSLARQTAHCYSKNCVRQAAKVWDDLKLNLSKCSLKHPLNNSMYLVKLYVYGIRKRRKKVFLIVFSSLYQKNNWQLGHGLFTSSFNFGLHQSCIASSLQQHHTVKNRVLPKHHF